VAAFNAMMGGVESALSHPSYAHIAYPPAELVDDLDLSLTWNAGFEAVHAAFQPMYLPDMPTDSSTSECPGGDVLSQALSPFWRAACSCVLQYVHQHLGRWPNMQSELRDYVLSHQGVSGVLLRIVYLDLTSKTHPNADALHMQALFAPILAHVLPDVPSHFPYLRSVFGQCFEDACAEVTQLIARWSEQFGAHGPAPAKRASQAVETHEAVARLPDLTALGLPAAKVRKMDEASPATSAAAASMLDLLAQAKREVVRNKALLKRLALSGSAV
jgi:hypothetical protein